MFNKLLWKYYHFNLYVSINRFCVNRKMHDISFTFRCLAYFSCALTVDFINTDYRMHRDKGPLDMTELGFQVFFRRINDNGGFLTENNLFHLDKADH